MVRSICPGRAWQWQWGIDYFQEDYPNMFCIHITIFKDNKMNISLSGKGVTHMKRNTTRMNSVVLDQNCICANLFSLQIHRYKNKYRYKCAYAIYVCIYIHQLYPLRGPGNSDTAVAISMLVPRSWCPNTIFLTNRNQGSFKKLIPVMGQSEYKMNVEHLVCESEDMPTFTYRNVGTGYQKATEGCLGGLVS